MRVLPHALKFSRTRKNIQRAPEKLRSRCYTGSDLASKRILATLTCKQGRCKGAPVLAVDFWKDGTCTDDVGVHQCTLVTPNRIVSNRIHVDNAIGVWFSSDKSVRIARVIAVVDKRFVQVEYLGRWPTWSESTRVPGNRIVLHRPNPTALHLTQKIGRIRISSRFGFGMFDIDGGNDAYMDTETGLPISIFE